MGRRVGIARKDGRIRRSAAKFENSGVKGRPELLLSQQSRGLKKMAYVLPRLGTKRDVDSAIKSTVDKVLVLRFGREADAVCMQLDEIVSGPDGGNSIPHCS